MKKDVYIHISKITQDPIIEWRNCAISGEEFAIFQSDKDFYDKISPVFGGKKYQIPLPTLCPTERIRKRYMMRNQTKLYKRTCDGTKKTIVSVYAPNSPHVVYDKDFWRSDQFDGCDFSIEMDIELGFKDNFSRLFAIVPHCSLTATGNENSDYANYALNCKDCYLLYGGGNNQDCLYCDIISGGANNIDCHLIFDSERCFECINIKRCYDCISIKNSNACVRSILIEECDGCSDCIMCFGLQNKQYYFLNTFVGKEKIEELKKQPNIIYSLLQQYGDQMQQISNNIPRPSSHITNSDLSWGEGIFDSHKCFDAYNVNNAQDSKYISFLHNIVGSQDIDYASPFGANYSYNLCSSTGTCYSMSTFSCFKGTRLFYCMLCYSCTDCFGCISLHNKQYCIFNKQYSKEEYEHIVPQIIAKMIESGERGEFFDSQFSPFGYNETVAQAYYPLTKEEAIARGYRRQNETYPINIPQGIEMIHGKDLGSDIHAVGNEILEKAIICEISGKPFRIIAPELAFYRKYHIPLPRKHPDIRHQERINMRPNRTMYLRTCDKTGEEILSAYPADAPFTVYSEEAYKQEVYG